MRGRGGIAALVLLTTVLLSGLLSIGSVSTASTPSSSWTVTPTPQPTAVDVARLNGVSCASASNCFAVGYDATAAKVRTLVEAWDGTQWTAAPSPNPDSTFSQLQSVSCASPSLCVAVGVSHYGPPHRPLIELWNGTSWSVSTAASPPGTLDTFLDGVSCASTTRCTAVGQYEPRVDPVHGSIYETLVETWDGTTWSVTPSPNPAGTTNLSLSGVSCPSVESCVAVGTWTGATGFGKALVESFDGTTWSVVPTPNATSNDLIAVSCANPTACLAVGQRDGAGSSTTLGETWNGTTWSVTPVAVVAGSSRFDGVSCLTATNCVAVGVAPLGPSPTALIEEWDGSSWSPIPSPSASTNDVLHGVSCPAPTSCFAVGGSHDDTTTLAVAGPSLPRHVIVPGVATVAEGNSGTVDLQVPVTLSNPSSETVTADWQTVFVSGAPGNQADPATDYTPASGTVTFAPGATAATVSVPVKGDTLVEPDEYVVVQVGNPTNAVMGGFWGLGFGVIGNDDHAVIVPGSASIAEGDAGPTELSVPVTLSNASTETVTADWQTVFVSGAPGNQADPTTDYTPASGTVTFAPGQTSRTITISVRGDTVVEPDEYVVVQVGSPTNAVMGGFWGLGFGLIQNDD